MSIRIDGGGTNPSLPARGFSSQCLTRELSIQQNPGLPSCFERFTWRDTGRIERTVQFTERGHSQYHPCFDLIYLAHIDDHRDSLRTECLDFRLDGVQAGLVEICETKTRAIGS